MPTKLCGEAGCPRPATAKGRCDYHRRTYERERSVQRRGGYMTAPRTELTAARDADPGYRYPKRRGGTAGADVR